MHCLIKYFANRQYLNDFLSGQLYMNTLDYFWSKGFEEQKDIFEGVVVKHNLLIKNLVAKIQQDGRQYIRLAVKTTEEDKKLIAAIKEELSY